MAHPSNKPSIAPSYITVTELPGARASEEQISRLFSRYHFASKYCVGKDVLEVACGTGIGLGYLEKFARAVVGGDIDEDILQFAIRHYSKRSGIEIRKLDAEKLPFSHNSFDLVILFEAIYYIAKPASFAAEARRVLRQGGTLLICTVNKDWPDFNPSPYSTKYFSVHEIYRLLKDYFADVEIYGGFQAIPNSISDKMLSIIKRTAVGLHLIPNSMKGKELFKRVFFGKLKPLPSELNEDMCEYVNPVPIPHDAPNRTYKVLYAVAQNL